MNWLKHSAFSLLWPTTCILLLSISGELRAQTLLTREDAVRITLENNYGIRIARNNVEIAENNTSKRNTGHLPTLTARSGGNYEVAGSSTQVPVGAEHIAGLSEALESFEPVVKD